MRMKRIISAATMVAVAASAVSVSASAASGRLELLTVPVSSMDDNAVNIGTTYTENLYGLVGDNDYISSFASITQKDIRNWRSTGDFTFTGVTVDGDVDRTNLGNFSNMQGLFNRNEDGDIVRRYAYDFNGTDTLKITYDSSDWFYMRDDGYIVELDYDTNHVNVKKYDGNVIADSYSVSVPVLDGYSVSCYATNNEHYLSYIRYVTNVSEGDYPDYDIVIDGLSTDGELVNIYSGTDAAGGISLVTDDYMVFWVQDQPYPSIGNIFVPETGAIYSLSAEPGEMQAAYAFGENDNIFVFSGVLYKTETGRETGKYYLVKIDFDSGHKSGNARAYQNFTLYDCELLTDEYQYIDSFDGEYYLAETMDGKWGYINSDGKLLATFDDAGPFNGKYAPVVKDGKAFLINRSFKRVSEKIDAEGVWTMDKGLYWVTINGEKYLMTYGQTVADSEEPEDEPSEEAPEKPADEPSEEAPSQSGAEDEASSAPADAEKDENKGNPDTGAGSAAVGIGAVIIAAGAMLLSRKHS